MDGNSSKTEDLRKIFLVFRLLVLLLECLNRVEDGTNVRRGPSGRI